MDNVLRIVKKIIPRSLFIRLQPAYHYALAFLSAIVYRFPSRSLYVVAVTGTKGKSSTAEIIYAVLSAAGYKTALASTIRFSIGDASEPNLYKMTMPGRFFLQRFLRHAVDAGATHAVIEMTSEGAKQYRHAFIDLDALVFTNLSPEHIESHGSFEKYLQAKLRLRDSLAQSPKQRKVIVANIDDEHGKMFLDAPVRDGQDAVTRIGYSLNDAKIEQDRPSIAFTENGTRYTSSLQGTFNVYNMLAAIALAHHLSIAQRDIVRAIANLSIIPGRVEPVLAGQAFPIIVDYAHTPDSLEKLYKTFEGMHTVCVLGATGGGRDKWKRALMGKIADANCTEVILTDEDPYDEDPRAIVNDLAHDMTRAPRILMDRREAIREAIRTASESSNGNSVVLITGKGTDPYIMRKDGAKEPWSDRAVAHEEAAQLLGKHGTRAMKGTNVV